MKKSQKVLSYISATMFLLSLIIVITFIIFCIKGYFINHKGESEPLEIILFCIVFCLFTYLGSLFKAKEINNNRYLKYNLILYLVIYIILFYYFTNINRGINLIFSKTLKFNLIPLKGIIETIYRSIYYRELNGIVLLLGNFLILVPLAFFYPRLFKKTQKFSWFLLCIIATTFMIETSQLIIGGGVFDIDDIILNTLGPACLFPLLNCSFLSKVLDKIFLLENNNLQLKEIIKSGILLFVLVLTFLGCIYYYWYHDFAISFQIINKSEVCEEDKILIYEDSYYYYYGCKNIDDLYVEINEKKLYPLKDVLDGKVKSRYLKSFDGNVLKYMNYFELKPKYPILEVKVEKENVSIVPESGFNNYFYFADARINDEEKYTSFKAMLVPKKEGQDNLVFGIYKRDDHTLIEKITYEINIDKELNITYQEKNNY